MSYLSAEKAETELAQSIKKACSIEETAPKQKHVRSELLCCARVKILDIKTCCIRMYRLYLGSQNFSYYLEYFKGSTFTF